MKCEHEHRLAWVLSLLLYFLVSMLYFPSFHNDLHLIEFEAAEDR